MANHKSSEKRARSTEKKRQRNSNYLSSVRTAVKKYRFAL
ncbi:MAG: 30S ribosomal protein S20, partial [Proteobacteria bacterium]|nr:30S ribosomal protein S20 [Pseudomonadota bacterium]